MAEGLVIRLPADVVKEAKLPPGELEAEIRREVAVVLYRRGLVSIGQAQSLSGMTRWQFEELIGERDVVRDYSAADLEEDLQYARGSQ